MLNCFLTAYSICGNPGERCDFRATCMVHGELAMWLISMNNKELMVNVTYGSQTGVFFGRVIEICKEYDCGAMDLRVEFLVNMECGIVFEE